MIIEPKILKGFRDALPDSERRRRDLIYTLEMQFRSFGFEPIDTPVLEYTEVLLGKGSGETDKQIYRFTDNGGRDVAMRFDLTVPFARYMAGHLNELYEPFKRYHIDKVWRGENTQKGRYREFYQCDFDIVGVDSSSADFEILLMIHESLQAIGIDRITISVSHRGMFNAFLETVGVTCQKDEILRIVDKLSKIGQEQVIEQLSAVTNTEKARKILSFITKKESNEATYQNMIDLIGSEGEAALRLKEVFALIQSLGLSERFVIDPSITRGLDYYTGIVYETILEDDPSIGSICSGGRYNDLASLYTKRSLPGVGASIGLDRLLSALEERQETVPSADVLIFCLDESLIHRYHSCARELRAAGLKTEVYPMKKKLNAQFKYAERKGFPYGVFIGETEAEHGEVTLKDLDRRQEYQHITTQEAIELIRSGKER